MGDLIGLICPELGVAPLMDPGTDLEDEQPTPVGSPSPGVDKSVPLSAASDVDLELARALLEVGLASDGDAHRGYRGGVFHDPCGVPCTPDSGVVVGGFGSPGDGFRQGGVQLGTSPCCARYRLLVP